MITREALATQPTDVRVTHRQLARKRKLRRVGVQRQNSREKQTVNARMKSRSIFLMIRKKQMKQ